jgi:hypothetical protein
MHELIAAKIGKPYVRRGKGQSSDVARGLTADRRQHARRESMPTHCYCGDHQTP